MAATPGPAPLSQDEVDFLRAHGGTTAAAVIDTWSPDAERQDRARIAVRQFAGTLSNSVSVKEAASVLGIDRSRISRRISGKSLWAFDFQGGWRIPRWQFLDGALLPGLDAVVPAIPRGLSPSALDAFMHTAQPGFDNRTPVEHLAAGGDPATVAGFIADLGRW